MADAPDIIRRVPVTGSIPTVNFSAILAADRANPGGSILVAEMLKQASTKIEDRLDIYAAEEGRREGIKQGSVSVPDLKDAATIRGRAYNDAARASVSAQFDLKGREKLDALEEAYGADAGVFVKAAEAWQSSVLSNLETFDPAIALEFKTNYQLRQKAAQNRIVERQTAIARDRQMESALRLQMSLEEEMAGLSLQLFSAEPDQAAVVLKQMTANSARLVNLANQIGPDGRPLFSARERISFEKGAQDIVSENIGLSYLQSQSSPMQALQSLNDGSAAVRIVDENGETQSVPLTGLIGPTAVGRARKAYIEQLRGEISFQNLLEERSERNFRAESDALFSDLMILAQDGALSPKIVEAARSSLEPDRFLAVRALSKGGDPAASSGPTLARLSILDAEGQDIRADLVEAYESGYLKADDVDRLYQRNIARIQGGAREAVESGRDYLLKSLGVLSKEIGLGQSEAIGQAGSEYEIEVQKFITENDRRPTHWEAREVAEKIRERFSVISAENEIVGLPLPRSMSQAEKLSKSLNAQTIGEKIKVVNAQYLNKHGGNVAARADDPDYIREIELLQQYFDVLKNKEAKSAGQP